MKRDPKLMEELSDEFQKLRFDEARHIARGIATDENFPISVNLQEYIQKLQAFADKAKKLTETEQ